MHGGAAARASRGKSNTARVRHGLRAKYLPTEMVPDVLAYKRQLDKKGGAKELLKAGAAVAAARSDRVPSLGAFVAAQDAMRRNIAVVVRLEEVEHRNGETADPVINVVLPDFENMPMSVQGADGKRARVLPNGIDGGPPLIAMPDGSWRPAKEIAVGDVKAWAPAFAASVQP
jgi:hypothetical protein